MNKILNKLLNNSAFQSFIATIVIILVISIIIWIINSLFAYSTRLGVSVLLFTFGWLLVHSFFFSD